LQKFDNDNDNEKPGLGISAAKH